LRPEEKVFRDRKFNLNPWRIVAEYAAVRRPVAPRRAPSRRGTNGAPLRSSRFGRVTDLVSRKPPAFPSEAQAEGAVPDLYHCKAAAGSYIQWAYVEAPALAETAKCLRSIFPEDGDGHISQLGIFRWRLQ